MRVITPEIAWHYDHESTTTIDFHPHRNLLVVGGSDSTGQNIYLRVWRVGCLHLRGVQSADEFKN